MKNFTLILGLMLSCSTFAFNNGEIAILSSTGDQFYVILNGEFQNYQPEMRVTFAAPAGNQNELTVYISRYHQTISRNIKAKPNRLVTYRIVRPNGVFKLQYHSEVPLNPVVSAIPNSECEHHHYDPYGNNSQSHNGYYSDNGYADYNNSGLYSDRMSEEGMNRLKKSMDAEAFSSDKLRIANQVAKSKQLTAQQVKQIANMFTFSGERLKFAKTAYARCLNKSEYYEVMDVLTFSSEKDNLTNYINSF